MMPATYPRQRATTQGQTRDRVRSALPNLPLQHQDAGFAGAARPARGADAPSSADPTNSTASTTVLAVFDAVTFAARHPATASTTRTGHPSCPALAHPSGAAKSITFVLTG